MLPRLARFLDGAPLVAHTVSSDVGALARKGLVLDNLQLDTFELASIVLPQLESYSLASLVRHFGIAQTSQHRALPDAQVTRQLYLRLVERVEALDLGILREINAMAAPLMWPLKGDLPGGRGRAHAPIRLRRHDPRPAGGQARRRRGQPRRGPGPRGGRAAAAAPAQSEPVDVDAVAAQLAPGGQIAARARDLRAARRADRDAAGGRPGAQPRAASWSSRPGPGSASRWPTSRRRPASRSATASASSSRPTPTTCRSSCWPRTSPTCGAPSATSCARPC